MVVGLEDEAGKMNLDITKVNGACLVVSQFTLYGRLRTATGPASLRRAARSRRAATEVLLSAGSPGVPVETGRFGAMMEVEP